MKLYDRYANLFAKLPGLGNLWVRRLVAGLIALIAIVLVVAILATLLPLLPARFWQLLGLCAIFFGVLWWFTAGARRFSRRNLTRKRIGDLGPGNPDDEREPLARMTQAMNEAKATIQRSPEIDKGRDPIYRVPWFLFVGDAAADVAGLLKAANEVSTFPPPQQAAGDPNQLWRWWFFKSMIAIETHPRIVCDTGARLDRGLWYQALMQLATGRDRLPLNGLVVCIAAQTLLGNAEELKTVSLRLRRLVDEAMEHLQILLPVYYVVTGLERVTGYKAFRAALPQEAFAQAFGHRLPEGLVVNASASADIDAILQPIADRLHALRLSALRTQATIEPRRGVFEFVESIRRMSSGLKTFIGLQLEDNPFQRTPRWRGLYFAGAGTAGASGGAFVADLFTRFLPSDQPLASPSLKGKAGRIGIAAAGVMAMLGLSLYLSFGLSTARRDDDRLLAQTRAACGVLIDGGSGNRIASLASCGRTIEKLEVSADNTLLSFGIRRSDADIKRLKQTVVNDFSNLILAPYDQAIETDLTQGRVGIDHVLAVAQRLRMLEDCRSRNDKCLEREVPNNVVFDPTSRLFAPFISSDSNAQSDRESASALMSTYFGYLRWQKRSVLDAEEKRLTAQLGRLLAAYPPRVDDLERWSLAHGDPIKLSDFWLPTDRVVGTEAGQMPTIAGAYTLDTWDGVLKPMLATVADQVPEKKTLLDDFRTAYFSAYFRAWAAFQARFGEGLNLWRGHTGDLAQRAASHENPYQFFFKRAQRDLFGLPLNLPLGLRWSISWAEMRSDWLGAWRPLGHFVGGMVAGWFNSGSVKTPAWLIAMKSTEVRVLQRQEPLFTRGYLRLQGEGGAQEIYQIAADIYRAKGAPEQLPAADYAKLIQAVDKPDEKLASQFRADDLAAWSIVQGPSRLLLYLTLARAGEFIQQKWRESVVAPLASLSPKEQSEALYGEQGKLAGFVADWLKPFVTERERTPIKVAGIGLPLSANFAAVVSQERKALAVPGGAKPFLIGNFQFTAPSQLGRLNEGSAGTRFELECQDRVYSASSRADSLAEAKVAVFWSPETCLEARLKIALPDAPPPAAYNPLQPAASPDAAPATQAAQLSAGAKLIKLYPGVDGLTTLISDFKTGFKLFRVADFQSAYTPQQWNDLLPQLRAMNIAEVRVFLDVRPTDDLLRFLGAQTVTATLPTTILE